MDGGEEIGEEKKPMTELSPAFSFYPKDFVSSPKVQAMTPAEIGSYVLLLCAAWVGDPQGYLPEDDELLRRITRMSPDEWRVARPLIMACFECDGDGRVYNKRLLRERRRQETHSAAQRENANKRWDKRSGSSKTPVVCQRNAMALPPHCQSDTESCLPSSRRSRPDAVIASSTRSKPPYTAPGDASVIGADTAIEDPACVVSSGLVMEFVTTWNALGAPFAHLKSLGPRQNALAACWREAFFREHWQSSLRRMAASAFCSGCGERGWIADVGWFLKPATVHELDEGKYDNRSPATPASKPIPGRRSEMNESDKWKDVVGA